jgi:hypothetical protein
VGIRDVDHVAPSIRKSCTNFVDKRRSLGRYSIVLYNLAIAIHNYISEIEINCENFFFFCITFYSSMFQGFVSLLLPPNILLKMPLP